VVGIFPNEAVIVRLIGAVLVEANDERQLQHRYMQTLPATESATPLIDATPTQISTTAADTAPPDTPGGLLARKSDTPIVGAPLIALPPLPSCLGTRSR